jgi:hypothetical protein
MKKNNTPKGAVLMGGALLPLLGSLLVPRPMVYTFIAGHRASAFRLPSTEIIS